MELAEGRGLRAAPVPDCLVPTVRDDAHYSLKSMDERDPEARHQRGPHQFRDIITTPKVGNTVRRVKVPPRQ